MQNKRLKTVVFDNCMPPRDQGIQKSEGNCCLDLSKKMFLKNVVPIELVNHHTRSPTSKTDEATEFYIKNNVGSY